MDNHGVNIKILLYNIYMPHKKNKGFTLIELLIALGITTILGAIGTSNYFSYQSVQTIEAAASELEGTIRDTHQRAVSQDNSSAWGIYFVNTADGTNDYYEVFYGDNYASGTVLTRTTLASDLEFLLPTSGISEEVLFAKSTGLSDTDHTITIISVRDTSLLRTMHINKETGFITAFSGLSDAPVINSVTPNFSLNTDPVNITFLS